MKKASTRAVLYGSDMRAEYDFTGGVRGKHYHAMRAGYTITIRKADGTTVIKEVKPKEGAVILQPDVREYFPDSESVNATLRSLIRLIRTKRTTIARKAQGADTKRRVTSRGRSKLMKKA
jgi:hypothetical protein